MATSDVAHSGSANHDAHEHEDHAAPLWILISVWAALMVLTGLTVASAQLPFGRLDLVIAMFIATVKATLVCLFFMHLYWDRPIMGMMFLGCLGFVFLFISFVIIDSNQYMPAVEARQLDDPVILQLQVDQTNAPE